MDTVSGIIKKILKPGETPSDSSFVLISYEDPDTGEIKSAKMSARLSGLNENDGFVASGEFRTSTFRGRQEQILNARDLRPGFPKTENGIKEFLRGIFSFSETGIDFSAIDKMVGEFGTETLSVMGREPEKIIAFSSGPEEFGTAIKNVISARAGVKQASEMLKDASFDEKKISKILTVFQSEAYSAIKDDPYAVMRVEGIEFNEADKLGQKLGISLADERRIAAAIWDYAKQAESQGSTLVSLTGAIDYITKEYDLDYEAVVSHVKDRTNNISEHGRYMPVRLHDSADVFAGIERFYRAEVSAAFTITSMIENGRYNHEDLVDIACEKVLSDTNLDEFQRAAVKSGVLYPISVITGGPGTGKSTILESIIKVSKEVENVDVFVTAPTGKASKKTEEVTGMPGKTLQFMLGMHQNAKGETKFRVNADEKLPAKSVLIIDEVSMMDAELLAAALAAVPEDGRIILQGDPNQLPSVGAGRVMADLIEANINGERVIPVARLVNVYRQDKDSKINQDAQLILAGKTPDVDEELRGGVMFRECSMKDIKSQVLHMIRNELKPQGINIERDVAVICPQAPGYGGTWELNAALSRELNPEREDIPGVAHGKYDDKRMPLPRVGDRVMLTENDNSKEVMNGDVGFITGYRLDPDNQRRTLIQVKFDDGRELELPTQRWRDLILAYAITCHKSQGSQYPIVILPFSSMHAKMADKSLVYTGWTRAKKMVVGVGEKAIFEKFIKADKSSQRYTLLRRMLETVCLNRGMKPIGGVCHDARPALVPDASTFDFKKSAQKHIANRRPAVNIKTPGSATKPATASTPTARPAAPKVAIARPARLATTKPVSTPAPEKNETDETAAQNVKPVVARPKVVARPGIALKVKKPAVVSPAPKKEPEAPAADVTKPKVEVAKPKITLARRTIVKPLTANGMKM